MSRKVRSILALLVLTLFLGTGAAHALPAEGPSLDRAPGMLVAIWEWVTSLWGAEGSLLPVHEAVEVSVPPPPTTTGGYIDPNGGS